MSRIIQVNGGQNNVDLNKTLLGAGSTVIISLNDFKKIDPNAFTTILTDLGPGLLFSAPVNLSSITTNAQIVATITPGFVGRVSSAFAIVTVPATTAAKSANIELFIDQDGAGALVNTAVGGGNIALTSANATPAGKTLGASMVTFDNAANPSTFTAISVLTFVTTALPTAFAEGTVVFGVLLAPINKTGPLVV